MKTKTPFYLRQWRKHRGYTLEKFSEMTGMSVGNLSDLERRKHGFSQDHLELFAEHLHCDPADLIMRDPTGTDAFWSIWEGVEPEQRPQALAVLKTFSRKAS